MMPPIFVYGSVPLILNVWSVPELTFKTLFNSDDLRYKTVAR